MMYTDGSDVRLQKSNLRYLVLPETSVIHSTRTKMHLEFKSNVPIGPTMLVEWTDD